MQKIHHRIKYNKPQLNQDSSAIHLVYLSPPHLPHSLSGMPIHCSLIPSIRTVAQAYILSLGFLAASPIGYTLVHISSHLNQIDNVLICLPASYFFVPHTQIHFQRQFSQCNHDQKGIHELFTYHEKISFTLSMITILGSTEWLSQLCVLLQLRS